MGENVPDGHFLRDGRDTKRYPVFLDGDISAFDTRDHKKSELAGEPSRLDPGKEPAVIGDGDGIKAGIFCTFYHDPGGMHAVHGPVRVNVEVGLHGGTPAGPG
jgi:hypothetical protein